VILGAVVVLALFLGLGAVGGWAWGKWDERERAAARRERLPALDRQFAIGAFTTLPVVIVSLVVAAMNAGNQGRVFALLLGGIGLGVLASIIVLAATRLAAPEAGAPTETAELPTGARTGPGTATSASDAPEEVRPQPARGTPRTPRAAPRTSRRGSRRPPHSGESEA